MRVERDAHGGEMLGRGAAAAADDAGAGIAREADIVGHQLGRAGVVDVAAVDHRHAAVRLGDDDRVGARLGHAEHGDEQVGGADTAIAADGDRTAGKRGDELGERGRRDAHHGLARRVEARRGGEGHADLCGRLRGGADLLERRHGLDPDHVGAAFLQPLDLLDEDLDRLVLGERAERREQVAGRPDRARHHHRPPCCVGDGAGILRGEAVQFACAVLEAVQHQTGDDWRRRNW